MNNRSTKTPYLLFIVLTLKAESNVYEDWLCTLWYTGEHSRGIKIFISEQDFATHCRRTGAIGSCTYSLIRKYVAWRAFKEGFMKDWLLPCLPKRCVAFPDRILFSREREWKQLSHQDTLKCLGLFASLEVDQGKVSMKCSWNEHLFLTHNELFLKWTTL